jgi:HPt (histidine-containing phosphotransfer) domain-containing protein
MDGYAATAAIRHREATGGRRLPIVAMTANAMAGDAERCLAAGMDDYMSKPVKIETVAAKLATWVSAARAERGATPGSAAPDAAPLDAEAFGALRALGDGDPGFVADVVAQFTAEASASLSALALAANTADAAAVKRAAHTLASVSGHIGASTMAALCGQLQILAAQGSAAGALECVARLAAEYERVRRALAQECPLPA